MSIIKENQDKVKWNWLSLNPNALSLLKENPDKINWSWLSSNPSIFKKVYNNDDKLIIQKSIEIILIK